MGEPGKQPVAHRSNQDDHRGRLTPHQLDPKARRPHRTRRDLTRSPRGITASQDGAPAGYGRVGIQPDGISRMATVYLLRHGEADFGPLRGPHWPGATADLAPLTANGQQQAVAAAQRLVAAGARAIVSSPMTRALQTAALVASCLGLLVDVDPGLREWIPDDTLTVHSYADVAEDFERCGGEWPAGERRAWEPLSQVRERAGGALRRSLARAENGHVLIAVSHEMVIRALTGEYHTGMGEFRRLGFP